MKNNIYSVIGMALLFILVQVIAIVIAPVYSEVESEAMGGKETIENPCFSIGYLVVILVFTFFILWIAKRKKERFIKYLILAAIFMTITYLFIPLTIAVVNPSTGDGWELNDIGSTALFLVADDIDGDGVVEIVAGCEDRRIRVYESENHTLEWESGEFSANITQILVGFLDTDFPSEIVVLTDRVTVLDGANGFEEWNHSADTIRTVAAGDLNFNGTQELLAGMDDGNILTFESWGPLSTFNLSSNLNNITHLQTTDEGLVVASDGRNITVYNPDTSSIDLEITELGNVTALTVYPGPLPRGEDMIIAADNDRAYIYNLTGEEYLRRGPELEGINNLLLESYSIPDFEDPIPDVIAVTDRYVYIIPDLLENDGDYYFLRFKRDIHAVHSADVDRDETKEMFIGVEDGYIHTSIVFGEGPNYLIPVIISIIIAFLLTLFVHKYPEWWVVDTVGVVMAIGAVVILGVTFAILPAFVLLIVLAVYDAISVYKTKHMITLADSVIELNLPVLLVIPKKRDYSYRVKKPRLKEQIKSGKEREAMFMGLGDIVIPSLLIISSISFLPSNATSIGIASNMLVGLGTMIGIMVGFLILMTFVMKGNPQAGLPLLNSGALIGYIVTYLMVFGDYGFGFNLGFL